MDGIGIRAGDGTGQFKRAQVIRSQYEEELSNMRNNAKDSIARASATLKVKD